MDFKEQQEWRENLKVGDKVGFRSRYGVSIQFVHRVTKTQVLVIRDGRATPDRYRKRNGHEVGDHDPWGTTCMVPVSEISGRLKEQERHGLWTGFLGRFGGSEDSITVETIAELNAVLDKAEGK